MAAFTLCPDAPGGRLLGSALLPRNARKSLEIAYCSRWDRLRAAASSGVWLGFTRWSSGRLAASHLQGPKTWTTQLDHLLSLVPDMKPHRGELVEPLSGRI